MAMYRLILKHKDLPSCSFPITCYNAQEALHYKRKAVKQGYDVEVRRLNEEEDTKKV